MPDINPAGAPATGATGQQPGATSQQPGPQNQGPNDPYQPAPASGAQGQPATGQPAGQQDQQGQPDPNASPLERRVTNLEETLRRVGGERDEARRLLEEEKRKGLSDDEKKRLQALDEKDRQNEAKLKGMALKLEIANRANRLGLVDPEMAVLMAERSDRVTVSETGEVSGLDDFLKDLIKERPYMVKAAPAADAGAGAAGPRPSGGRSMNDFIRQQAGHVTKSG